MSAWCDGGYQKRSIGTGDIYLPLLTTKSPTLTFGKLERGGVTAEQMAP